MRCRPDVVRCALIVAACSVLGIFSVRSACSQKHPLPDVSLQTLIERLEAAENEIRILKAEKFEGASPDALFGDVTPARFALPAGCGACGTNSCNMAGCVGKAGQPSAPDSRFYVDYDKGFVIRPYDQKKTPFELKINGRLQFRYNGFKSNGPTPSRNNFEVERGRVVLRGFVYDPALQYFLNIDADTDDDHDMKFHDFWVNYKFSDAFNLHAGKGKVAGSYTWWEPSIPFRFVDRDVATTFFRTDRTNGIWASGDVGADKEFHYHALIGNGLRTSDLEDEEVDDLFAASMMTWWNVSDDVGKGFSDLKWHECPAVRVGQTYAFANQNESPTGTTLPESRWVRLGNGTRLTDAGALAPGVTVNGFDYHLLSAFVLAKYQGWSANAEFYYRWINNFDTVGGAAPHADLEAHGFYASVGKMIVPKFVEVNARVSGVNTSFGDTWEYAGGVNWFIDGTHNQKIQFDVSVLDDIPTGNTSPNLEVGQNGILYRFQYQLSF